MTEVRRYDFKHAGPDNGIYYADARMIPCSTGKYVLSTDYDALAARVQAVERERDDRQLWAETLAVEKDSLVQQLAAMTAERDRAVETMVAFVADKGPISGWWGRACARLVEQRKEVEKQLAASQARVRELEQPRLTLAECVVVDYLEKEVDQLLPLLGVETALVTDLSTVGDFPGTQLGAEQYVWQAAIDLLRTQLATLQATLAERERRIGELERACEVHEAAHKTCNEHRSRIFDDLDAARQDAARLREALEKAAGMIESEFCSHCPEPHDEANEHCYSQFIYRALKGA